MNREEFLALRSGGQLVHVRSQLPGFKRLLLEAAGERRSDPVAATKPPDIAVTIEADSHPFDLDGFIRVTRGSWRNEAGVTVVEDVGASGFAMRYALNAHGLDVHARWVPSSFERAASHGLRSRFRSIRGQVLLHYPVLWAATLQGLAPLHVSLLEVEGVAVLLAGPSGVGKSTLVQRELAAGSRAACDNLAVSDGTVIHGLAQPLRAPRGGRVPRSASVRTSRRRGEPFTGRVAAMRPDVVVVVKRAPVGAPKVQTVSDLEAHRALIGGTYASGELRRFWPLSAMLALGTGRGLVHPPVQQVSRSLTTSLPCYELLLTHARDGRLAELLRPHLIDLQRARMGD